MFSKSKITDPIDPRDTEQQRGGALPPARHDPMAPPPAAPIPQPPAPTAPPTPSQAVAARTAPKPAPSIISADLTITGNMVTTGDMQVEGTVEGDIRSHLLTIGESATIRGEVIADDVVVNGRVTGRIRGIKVRLSSTAQVEGDVLHKTIAIEAGAHFDGSVQRSDDPLGENDPIRALTAAPSAPPAPPAATMEPPAAPIQAQTGIDPSAPQGGFSGYNGGQSGEVA